MSETNKQTTIGFVVKHWLPIFAFLIPTVTSSYIFLAKEYAKTFVLDIDITEGVGQPFEMGSSGVRVRPFTFDVAVENKGTADLQILYARIELYGVKMQPGEGLSGGVWAAGKSGAAWVGSREVNIYDDQDLEALVYFTPQYELLVGQSIETEETIFLRDDHGYDFFYYLATYVLASRCTGIALFESCETFTAVIDRENWQDCPYEFTMFEPCIGFFRDDPFSDDPNGWSPVSFAELENRFDLAINRNSGVILPEDMALIEAD